MTADHIKRATEVLNQSVVRQSINGDISITVYADGEEFEETLARALDAAGLLATLEHDAEVAARALREAANEVYGDERAAGQHWHPLSAASWLRDRAARIEAGESDAER